MGHWAALSGGAAHGAWQLGVLKRRIYDHNVNYEGFTTVSVGTLNGLKLAEAEPSSSVALKEKLGELEAVWADICTDKVYRKRWLGYWAYVAGIFYPSFFVTSPLRSLIGKNFRGAKRPIRIGAVSLLDGMLKVATEKDPDILSWAMASSSYPMGFPPERIGNDLLTDTGVRDVTMIAQAIKAGATEVDAIICSRPGNVPKWTLEEALKKKAIPDILFRIISIMMDEISLNDLTITGIKNDIAVLQDRYRHVKINLFVPTKEPSDDSLNFGDKPGSERVKNMIKQGYEDSGFLGPVYPR